MFEFTKVRNHWTDFIKSYINKFLRMKGPGIIFIISWYHMLGILNGSNIKIKTILRIYFEINYQVIKIIYFYSQDNL